jgi:hypothetical protein
MAVTINIGGQIGTVTADNAATESTLQALLQAMNQNMGQQRRQGADAADALRRTERGAQATSIAMGMVAGKTRNVSESMAQFSEAINKDIADAGGNLRYVFGDVTRLMGTFALTLASATTSYATNYKSIASNPIGAAVNTTAGAIDLFTRAAEGVSTGLEKVGLASMKTLNPVAMLAGAAIKVAGSFIGTLAPVIGAIAQKLNDTFGKELSQTVDNFRTLSASGAIFADGMTEMRNAAHSSGMSMDVFTRGIQQAGDSVRNLGYGFSGGVGLISDVAHEFSSNFNENGQSLTTQMLNLGFGFEDQIALTAEYMSSQRAGMTQDRMRTMTQKELALGTAQYAEDLTVLRTLTKEDAKAAAERARVASMQADIMAQLDPESAQRFQGVMRTMPAELQKAFMEQMSLGTVVDAASNIFLSQNQAAREGLAEAEQIVRNSSMTLGESQEAQAKITSRISQEQRDMARSGQVAINQAATAGIGGVISEVAGMINGIITGNLYDEKTVDAAAGAAERARASTDDLTNTTNAIITNSQSFAVQMEDLVTDFLPTYSKTLNMVNEAMFGMTKFMLDLIPGVNTEDKFKEQNQGGYSQQGDPKSSSDQPINYSAPVTSGTGTITDMNAQGAAQLNKRIVDNTKLKEEKNNDGATDDTNQQFVEPIVTKIEETSARSENSAQTLINKVDELTTALKDSETRNREILEAIATNTSNQTDQTRKYLSWNN